MDPIACPEGRVYQYTTASSADDCGDCPAGHYCLDGNPTPVLCDLGYYCPYGTTQETQRGCPEYTYGASYGLMTAAECTTCPLATPVTVLASLITQTGRVLWAIIVPVLLILCLVQRVLTPLKQVIIILTSVFRVRFTLTVRQEVQTSHLVLKDITAQRELVPV